MTGDGNPPTTDPTLPADNPPPPLPDFNAINGLTPAQRLPAINATQNTLSASGVTQSTEALDSVSAITDSDDNLMFHVVAGERVAVRVNNSNPDADWTANPPPLLSTSYIFDSVSFASKTLADYNDGDFYAVTGFWYRSPADFGVFADSSPRTVDLPTTRRASATYRGNVGGRYWGNAAGSEDTDAPSISGNFIGNVNLQIAIATDDSGIPIISAGEISIPADDVLENIRIDMFAVFGDRNGFFTGDSSNIFCRIGCSATPDDTYNLIARFVGNPVTDAANGADSDGWPAGIIGTFGIDDLSINNAEVDMLGFFGAIHEDLCAATGTGDNAFCTNP